MSPDEACDLLKKLGPIAREHGIDALELEGLKVRFRPRFEPTPVKVADDRPPAEKPPTFAGRTQEELGPILAGMRS